MANKLPGGLYALIDDQLRPSMPIIDKARAAVEGGARVLQVRLKTATDREGVALVRQVIAIAKPAGVTVIVNDRVDWALVAGADGVHVGDDDLPPNAARQLLGPQALIGVTTRNLGEIQRAQAQGADHVGLGPIFETRTKAVDAPTLGLEAFGQIARASPLPVVGIAGITLATINSVAKAGAHAAAVAGAWLLEPPAAGPNAAAIEADFTGLVSRAKALQEAFWRS